MQNEKIILYLNGWPNNGGSYQYWLAVLKVLSELDKKKYYVKLYSGYQIWCENAEKFHIDSVLVKNSRTFWDIYMERAYRRLPNKLFRRFCIMFNDCYRKLEKEKADLFIAQVVDGGGDIVDIPAVVPIMDLMHRYEPDYEEVASESEGREVVFRHQCETAEIILVDSEVGKEHVLESYGEYRKDLADHIRVLPMIPPDYIYNYTSIQQMPYELFDKYIFYPAQFWTHKNHENLIKAIAKLRDRELTINLILVGSEQNNRKNIEELIQTEKLEKQVKILGYVSNDEMVYLYQHARAMVMPTFFGPTNIPPLEGFVLGCPVATSRIYGLPEQVGDAALLFDPHSVDEIAECIRRLWTDDTLCSELIAKGKKRSEEWGPEAYKKAFIDIIETYFEKKAGY